MTLYQNCSNHSASLWSMDARVNKINLNRSATVYIKWKQDPNSSQNSATKCKRPKQGKKKNKIKRLHCINPLKWSIFWRFLTKYDKNISCTKCSFYDFLFVSKNAQKARTFAKYYSSIGESNRTTWPSCYVISVHFKFLSVTIVVKHSAIFAVTVIDIAHACVSTIKTNS